MKLKDLLEGTLQKMDPQARMDAVASKGNNTDAKKLGDAVGAAASKYLKATAPAAKASLLQTLKDAIAKNGGKIPTPVQAALARANVVL